MEIAKQDKDRMTAVVNITMLAFQIHLDNDPKEIVSFLAGMLQSTLDEINDPGLSETILTEMQKNLLPRRDN